jgi:Phage gp6-like head-tail connector protein
MDFVIVTTVVTPATAAFEGQQPYDLVDLATVKAELNITDTSKDSLLLRWITEASAAAANFCNRVFPVESLKDQIFPPRDYFPAATVIGGVMPLQLSRWPITASPTVTENGVALVENTDFIAKYDVGQLLRLDANGWPKRWPALPTVVQYQAGYGLTDPTLADLVDGVIRYVKGRYFAQMRDPALRSENIVGAYEAQYWFAAGPGATVGNLPPDIQALWEKYRAPVLGS